MGKASVLAPEASEKGDDLGILLTGLFNTHQGQIWPWFRGQFVQLVILRPTGLRVHQACPLRVVLCLPHSHAPAVSADKASVVPAGKTSVVPEGKTSAVSADKTSAVSQDIPLLWRTQGGAFGAPLCCL